MIATRKLILPPSLYEAAKKAAQAEGKTLGEFCQRVSPVPVEVYVQRPMPKPKPDIRSIPMWVDVPTVGDR
jgi:hypothetical protein